MNDKYIKPFMIFVSVALVLSLINNFNLLSKVGQLENRVNSLSSTQHNIANNINDQTNQIRNVLNEFNEEQSWIGRIEMNIEMGAIDQGEAVLNFMWQVKELYPHSEVDFHYAYGETDKFIRIQAEEIQQGLFQVNVPIEISLDPQWNVNRYTVNGRSKPIEKEVDKKATDLHSFRYYVSVTTDDKVRSGNILTEHLGHLGARYYGNIITDIRLEEKYFTVNLTYHRAYEETRWIEEVYLLTYENSTLIREQEIEFDKPMNRDNPVQIIRSDQLELDVQLHHVVKVRYSDGKTFQKEIN